MIYCNINIDIIKYIASYWVHNKYPKSTECTTQIQNEYSNSLGKYQWIFTFSIIFQAIFGPVGGKLDVLIGPRYTCLIASFLMGLGMFLTRYFCHVYALCVITLGVIFGSGLGIGFTGAMVGACSWWPNKGKVTGLVLASVGFSTLLFNSIQTIMINPNNIKLNHQGCGYVLNYDSVLINIPKCFLYLTIIFISLSLTGVMLLFPAYHHLEYIKNRDNTVIDKEIKSKNDVTSNNIAGDVPNNAPKDVPKDPNLNRFDLPFLTMTPTRLLTKQQVHYKIPPNTFGSINAMSESSYGKPMLEHQSVPVTLSSKKKPKYSVHISTLVKYSTYTLDDRTQQIQYTLGDAIKTVKFWQLYIILTLNYTINVFFLSEYKVISQNYFNITDDFFLLWIGNTLGFFYGLGRIIWGLYFDCFSESKYQFNIVMGSLVFTVTLLVALLPIIHYFLDDNKYAVLIVIALIEFSVAATYVPIPTTLSKSFGIQYAGVIFGALISIELPASITQSLLFKPFHNSMTWIFIIFVIMGIISCLLSILYRTSNDKLRKLSKHHV